MYQRNMRWWLSLAGVASLLSLGGCLPGIGKPGSGSASPTSTPSSVQSSPDHYPWDDDFVPGDCVREARELAFDDLKIVDCSEIHRAEVFASFQVPDGDWPGDKRIKELADDGCRPKLRRYAKPEFQNGDYWFFHASADTWARGDRTVVCIAVFDEPRTDSIAK